jgi:transposase
MKRYDTITQTPMAIKAAHTYLKRLGFIGFINHHVTWDEKQVKLTPGQLALSVVLSTFCSSRYPLSRIPQHFSSMNTEMLFGKGVNAEEISDDAIARTLDKIYEAGAENLYSKLALTAFTTFDIPLGNLHSDTSSHTFYGDYDSCEDLEYDGIDITYGFSKEHRPDLKQIMVGNIVNADGIPLVHRTLDGNTSDCLWNQEAIGTLSDLLKDRICDVVYIADAKLVTEANLRLLHKHQMRFISRVPDSFCAKLTSRVKKEAYENCQWEDLGSIVADKNHAFYQGVSHTRYLGMEKVRLLVVKSSAGRDGFAARLQKERNELERKVREITRQEFACEPDAVAAAENFKKQGSKHFFSLSYTLSSTTTQKRRVGHPGKTPKPPSEVVHWHISFQITEKDSMIQSAQKQSESFVLVTNIPAEQMDDRTLLWRYKEQHVVETGFRWLRQPSMASTIFLKKPGRIVALMMLIHVALMIRALMQREARKRVGSMPEAPRIDLGGRKLVNPTAEKILVLLINHGVITDHGENYYSHCRDIEFERLQVLLQLLGIAEEELLSTD